MAGCSSFRILDRFCLSIDGQELPVKGQKQKAILAWFGLTGESGIARDRLADLLWSDSGAEKARGSLRNTLHVLARDCAGISLFDADRLVVRALFAGCPCDISQALAEFDAGDMAPLSARSLADADIRFAADLWGLDPEFDDFLAERKTAYLAHLAAQFRARLQTAGDKARARLLAERLRELEPQDEEATRALMRLDIAAGNNAAAMEHYRKLWTLLDEEFDLEPAEETQALAISLKLSATAAPVPAQLDEERITIFVQPFALSALSDDEQILVAAVQAELGSALYAVEDWVTIETSPGMQLPDRPGNYELRGSLSPGLEEMRLILSLKDLSTGAIIWSWPLHIRRGDWVRNSGFAVQRIAMRLTGKLESHYISGLEGLSDAELADYRKLMRAGWLMRDWSPDADRRAEVLLRSVTSTGDLGLRARVGLAELLNSRELIFPGMGPVHAGVPEALEIARACTSEAPERGDAWLAFGWSSILLDRIDGAAEAANVVADLSQSNPRRLSAASEMMALTGQVDRAARLAEAAATLDAGVCRVSMGYRTPVALLSGDFAAAMDLADRAAGAIPFTYAYGCAAAVMSGDMARAAGFWRRFSTDISARWQGTGTPDPLAWFLAATSMRSAHGLDRIADALWQIAGQRQDRVV